MFSVRDFGYKLLISKPLVALTDALVRRALGGTARNRGSNIYLGDPVVSPWLRTLIFWDMYETAELRLIDRFLPPNIDVIELGGSVGVVASKIASTRAKGNRLISVEANPNLLPLLKRNVAANSDGRDIVVHAAISYSVVPGGQVGFDFGDSSLSGHVNDRAECKVPRATLGELATAYAFTEFALIADIEGSEAGILIDDHAALGRCPIMILELHETRHNGELVTIAGLVSLAERLGYAVKASYRNVYAFARQTR